MIIEKMADYKKSKYLGGYLLNKIKYLGLDLKLVLFCFFISIPTLPYCVSTSVTAVFFISAGCFHAKWFPTRRVSAKAK